LVQHLLGQNHSVAAIAHQQSDFISSLKGDINIACGDLLDNSFINSQVKEHQPDIIYHLAAKSLPQVAWNEPALTFRTNFISSLKLFESAKRQSTPPLIITLSSSSVYASGKQDVTLSEESPIQPGGIYAASKLAMEQLAGNFIDTMGLKIIIVRPFFIIGPRKEGDVSSDFAKGIVSIERGEASELHVGNLKNTRDFLDVHDAVAALWQIAMNGKTGAVYNICSGRGHTIDDLLAIFKKNARQPVKTVKDPVKIRSIDDPVKIGDPAKLLALGWKPQIDLDKSVISILDYWRGRLK